ncbi:DUF4214 domain-containing protein [Actinotalea sp. K2]|uniref:DUF4214 domain-containing protein n=1 Tax=Actinotalea sp. K2 TaxID=2939438 RepID=UPI0020178074|nr:DUF4214 domain-containing protein [Actinotalea sp. K2]MCL3862698.1 DUF4214 domain-containing protein [Actinotalea sp. K2]
MPAPAVVAEAQVATSVLAGMDDAKIKAYIALVYADLFGRAVDPTGLATWSAALRSGTPPRAVADSITGSDEFRTGLITGAYEDYLGRAPERAGSTFWLQRMREGMTVQQLEAGFLGSDEYFLSVADGVDQYFIRSLYRDVLGRSPGDEEFYYWLSRLWGVRVGNGLDTVRPRPPAPPKMSREQIALAFLLSTERLAVDVDADYQWLLGRRLDASGRTTWVTAIQSGVRYESVIGSIISSQEYMSYL